MFSNLDPLCWNFPINFRCRHIRQNFRPDSCLGCCVYIMADYLKDMFDKIIEEVDKKVDVPQEKDECLNDSETDEDKSIDDDCLVPNVKEYDSENSDVIKKPEEKGIAEDLIVAAKSEVFVVTKLGKLPTRKLKPSTTEFVDVKQPPKECSKDCKNNCNIQSQSLTAENLQKLKMFKKQSTIETKNNLLEYLWAQDCILPDDKDGFVFGGFLYCLRSFAKLTNVSVFILRQVTDRFDQGIRCKFVHQSQDSVKLNAKSVQFMAWFQGFSKTYGQEAPDKNLISLPSFLTKRNVWEIYQEECVDPFHLIGYSTAVKLMKYQFGAFRENRTLPNVRFSRYSTHSTCDTCVDLELFQRSCKTQQELDICNGLKIKHKEKYGAQRIQIEATRNISQRLPEEQLSLYIDGMDNNKVRYFIVLF